MIKLRKKIFFKITTIVLLILFVCQPDFPLSQREEVQEPIEQFQEVKTDYKNGNFKNAKPRLERLIDYVDPKTIDKKFLAQVYLLLAATNEKIGQIKEAKIYYIKSKKIWEEIPLEPTAVFSKENEKKLNIPTIPGIDFSDLRYHHYYIVKGKKKFPLILAIGVVVVTSILIYILLKKTKYTLSVTKGEGVEGYPETNFSKHKKGEILTYSYTLKSGYINLVVSLDGIQVEASGSFKMDRDRMLSASTNKSTTGNINVQSTPDGADIWIDGINTGKKTNFLLSNIEAGIHTVKLTKQGYWNYEKTLTINPNQTSQVSANLEKFIFNIEWKRISGGEFEMGDNFNEGENDERPVHKVFLDEYFISKYEITFEQYDKFCKDQGIEKPYDAGWGRGQKPVINVSWNDAVDFCNWLSNRTGENIHLPTEAQWEKAASGTARNKYTWGNAYPRCSMVNYFVCVGGTTPVGSYESDVSPYGVYDMAGNVMEWCQDWYSSTYYSESPYRNPQGPNSGLFRVMRGGAILCDIDFLRSASRHRYGPKGKKFSKGFRICKE